MFQLESQTKDSFSGTRLQPKLKIGQPGDKYEQEADAVADRVMRMGVTDTMQMEPEEEEESLQMKPVNDQLVQMKCRECEEEEEMLQAKSDSGGGYASPEISQGIKISKGKGTNLPSDTNQFMSRAFGSDFSHVNIHTGSNAVQMNQTLGARAFTTGNDIFFNDGQYNTNSNAGKHLLAHELTHTVQQGGTAGMLQAEFSVEPTTPSRTVLVLTPAQMTDAIAFNQARHTDVAEIGLMRDILGLEIVPSVIDEDFVNALIEYQAQFGLTRDGKLGGTTAAMIAREIIAESDYLGPGNAGSLAPEFVVETGIRNLITANNTTYQDYKVVIQAGTMVQGQVALHNQQLLTDLIAQLTWNEWARCIELLGRIAPTGEEMRTNATVRAGMNVAWANSNSAVTIWSAHDPDPALAGHACNPPVAGPPPSLAHEEGGYVYMNLITGNLTTRAIPRGAQAAIPFPVAALVADSVAVGLFHTHPNVGACWGAPFLSGADIGVSTHYGLPMLMIGAFPAVANTSFHAGGVTRRAHLAGTRGGPGTIAPQATIDGSIDEV